MKKGFVKYRTLNIEVERVIFDREDRRLRALDVSDDPLISVWKLWWKGRTRVVSIYVGFLLIFQPVIDR